ncbi:MAG: hypothetical protein WCP45_17325 [Verrucomicrobiota bacterium]
MIKQPTLLIGRCSFWPEARDPEAWFRALVTLADAEKSGTQAWTHPRSMSNTVLRGHLSRRGVPGLFGLDSAAAPAFLHGVGLLESDAQHSVWQLSAEARELLTIWQTADHRQAMEQLALHLLRRSAWLRLATLKLQSGTWQLCRWDEIKASNGQLRMGKTLLLGNDTEPAGWLLGIEEAVLGAWWPQLFPGQSGTVQIHAPKTTKPDDGVSLSPLKSPFYLLDSLGWLDSCGRLRLPAPLAHEPFMDSLAGSKPSATLLLNQATAAMSDHRGVFPLEPVMLRFAQALDVFPHPTANDSAFIAWTDRLLTESFRVGAIELFSSEPGQPRHGRGLFGDSRQKLLRWRVHEGFDSICTSLASSIRQPATATQL